MNILVPDSWLRDFIKTKASPKEIAESLRLCSLNVEKIRKEGGDSIYEIEIPPNRYDCLSVLGVAREVYASLGNKPPQGPSLRKGRAFKPQYHLNVKLDPNLCPHFAALILDSVKIKPSPKKIQDRLEKAGIRALNNVIDTTNYIMLELGQPMHAFDYDKLTELHGKHKEHGTTRKMILRESRAGESLVTLDGVEQKLPKGSIVIEDGEKLIDLCGIMGGKNSEIDQNTKRVILFAQIYDSLRIRKTSMKLGLRTEAAQRFEKGLDPEMVLPALFKAVEMLEKNADAQIASELINIRQKEFKPHKVQLTMAKLNTYLGVEIDPKKATKILETLGFRKAGPCRFKVPSWRDQDMQIEEDLIEEVARIHGYHRIPSRLPSGHPPLEVRDRKFDIEKRLKFLLKDLGFTEVYTYSMVPKNQIADQRALKLKNPLTHDLEYLKIDPIPNLLKVVEENKDRFEKIKIFEMANIYWPEKEGELPQEKMILAGVSTAGGFYEIKGIVETILDEFNVTGYKFEKIEKIPFFPPYDRNRAAVILPTKKIKSGKIIGRLGRVEPSEGFNPKVWAFDLHIDALVELSKPIKPYQPIPQFPPIIEDLSIIVDYHTLMYAIKETIDGVSEYQGIRVSAELIDIYEDEKLRKEGKKSLTFRITYQAPDRSLSDKEVKPLRERIIKELERKHNAKVRR